MKTYDPRHWDDPADFQTVPENPDAGLVYAWTSRHRTVEHRVTSSTGGQKGTKPQRMDLLPPDALILISEVYGFGAAKYDDHNYRKGYDWSLSYAALQRHLNAFWNGEDLDPESGLPHLGHAAFHCMTLITFMSEHPEFDDRYKKGQHV